MAKRMSSASVSSKRGSGSLATWVASTRFSSASSTLHRRASARLQPGPPAA